MARKELIDFLRWFIRQRFEAPSCCNPEELIDSYLKSINSAQVETPNVSQNEAKEKVCHHPYSSRYWAKKTSKCLVCGAIFE